MSVLSDKWIKQAAKTKGMIKPFVSKQIRKGKISFGLSSYGYDARVSNEFKIFTNVNSGIVDPKVFKKDSFVTKIGKECIIPPNSFALARTVEYFKIPENVLVICLGKSTYARCGIIVNVLNFFLFFKFFFNADSRIFNSESFFSKDFIKN